MKINCALLVQEIDESRCEGSEAPVCKSCPARKTKPQHARAIDEFLCGEWVNDFFDGLNDFKAPSGEVMQIWTPDEKRIVERLRDADQMKVVYEELENKITNENCPTGNGDLGRKEVLHAIVDAFFDYEAKKDGIAERLKEKQGAIAKTTAKLIKQLQNFEASRENGLVDSEAEYPKTLLQDLEILQSEMHRDVTATTPWTAAALGREASLSAFVRSFLTSVYSLRGINLPVDFRPSRALIVVITKAALEIKETRTQAWAGQIRGEFEEE